MVGCSLGYVKIAYRHSYADDAAIYKNDPCKTSFRMVKESCRSDDVEKIVGWVGLGCGLGWVEIWVTSKSHIGTHMQMMPPYTKMILARPAFEW